MESRLFGLTETEVKKNCITYNCCKRNIKHPFNDKDKAACWVDERIYVATMSYHWGNRKLFQ